MDEDLTISRALDILQGRLRSGPVLRTPQAVQTFLRLQSAGLTYEVFAVMYLDAESRLIDYERLFRGTLTKTAVFPREVVKNALAKNAAAVILHHNHPSDTVDPSSDDHVLTDRLIDALRVVDVRVIDHVITSDAGAFSMAQQGMLD